MIRLPCCYCFWPLAAAVLLLLQLMAHTTTVTQAFTTVSVVAPPARTTTTTTTTTTTRRRNTVLHSSSNDENNDNDAATDELSKLMDRRLQIKQRRQQEAAAATPEPDESTTQEALVDLDLDRLPQFKTERTVRGESKQDYHEEKEDDEKKKKKLESPVVDYLADYADEHDSLHIPNRIVLDTTAWGNPAAGYNPGKNVRLTKRQTAAGQFVAGDALLGRKILRENGVTAVTVSSRTAAQLLQTTRSDDDDDEEYLPAPMTFVNAQVPLRKGTVWMEDILETLGTETVESYATPLPRWFPSQFWCRRVAPIVEGGETNHLGIAGVTRPSRLRKIQRTLDEQYEVSLATASFDFSLTNDKHRSLLAACRDLGITPLCTNPLDANKLASGVYTATNPTGGLVGGATPFSFKTLDRWQPLHSVQETVAERVYTRLRKESMNTDRRSSFLPPPPVLKQGSVTTTQVAINYVRSKGGVPVVAVNTPKVADEVVGCLGWLLTDDEMKMLDQAVALCNS